MKPLIHSPGSQIILSFIISLTCHAQTYIITDFGAVSGGPVNTVAIQRAIDSCAVTGGTVLVPSGSFVTGTIILKSNVSLQVAGTLKGSSSINDYPDIIPSIRSITDGYQKKALIYAEGERNISITGDGIIDASGGAFLGANDRPFGIRFISCRNILYENVELRNAAFWMMHNFNVDTLTMRNLTVSNNSLNSNNDGIGVDGCRNVLIENCTVSSLDDPMALKTSGPFDCENIVVRNCTLTTFARAIKIGTETVAGFKNVLIENCVVNKNLTDADCGINLSIVDGGFMDGVTLQNITIDGVKTALFLRLGNQGKKYMPGIPDPPVGSVKNVTFRNIEINAATNLTSSITGIPGYYAENITLEDVTINLPGGEAAIRPGFVVPENETARPNCDIFGDTLPAHGLYIRHVKNMKLDNVCFNSDVADQRPALVMEDVIASPAYTAIQTGMNQYCLPELPSGSGDVQVNQFTVIPHPHAEILEVRLTENSLQGVVEIFDLTGKRVFRSFFSQEKELHIGFNANPGVYFCRIKSENGNSLTQKFKWAEK